MCLDMIQRSRRDSIFQQDETTGMLFREFEPLLNHEMENVKVFFKMARWSSGQDGGLSRPNREFDSPSGHHMHL